MSSIVGRSLANHVSRLCAKGFTLLIPAEAWYQDWSEVAWLGSCERVNI